MRLSFVILTVLLSTINGAPGCIAIKRKYSDYGISRKPRKDQNGIGACGLTRSCCPPEVERLVLNATLGEVRRAPSEEVQEVKEMLDFIQSKTAITIATMVEELVPKDLADHLDIAAIAEVLWQYSMGEISAYNLTIEVAVIGSGLMFNENAKQDIIETTECIIRELGKHATTAFVKIAAIVEELLIAPRTFGEGFQVASTLLDSIKNVHIPSECNYGQLFGCPKCGIKVPSPCRSTCLATAKNCLTRIGEQKDLWNLWVDSIARLTDAMVLMKDIEINPDELVNPELIEEVMGDILGAIGNVNIRQCQSLKTRSSPMFDLPDSEIRPKRQANEGLVLKTLLINYFDAETVYARVCSGIISDKTCWLGNKIGDYEELETVEPYVPARIPKSHDPASFAVNSYVEKVDAVITDIHTKVRQERSRMSVPDGYSSYTSSSRGAILDTMYQYIILFVLTLANLQIVVLGTWY